MRRFLLLALAVMTATTAATGNPASTVFTRAANAAESAAFELQIATTAGSETWQVTGQDVTPFYYEQGMAHGGEDLVFSSRDSLTRTSVGCAAPLDPYEGCYDVRAETVRPIPSELAAEGINHVGGIDIGSAGGPGASTIFAPLEKDAPRTVRALAAYDLSTLTMTGLLVERETHRYHSWVAVDPTSRYVIVAQDGFAPIRVYAIARDGGGRITFTRRTDLDVTASPATLPNMQGCKFAGATTLYCTNWAKVNSYFDVRTEVYRVDLSAPVGTPGATATWSLAFTLKAQPRYGVTSNVPYGLETEDLAFWGGELHIQLRGEALAWTHVVHLAQGA